MEVIEAAREPLGFPCVMAMVQQAQQWLAEHQDMAPALAELAEEEEEEVSGAWWQVEDAEVDEALVRGAEERAVELLPATSGWARQCGKSGFGRPWDFTVGLVGKPSAGKSTLFNAATCGERRAKAIGIGLEIREV